MKTITALLKGIFTLILSVASLIYSIVVVSDSTTLYYKANQTEPTTFTTTFVVIGILLFALGLQLLSCSFGSFKRFNNYHNRYLENKRDRQIRTQLTNEAYQQLYKELSKTTDIEEKEQILKSFYREQDKQNQPNNLDALLKSIISR